MDSLVVLIVGGDERLREVMTGALHAHGAQVISASGAEQLLQVIHNQRVDAMVMNLWPVGETATDYAPFFAYAISNSLHLLTSQPTGEGDKGFVQLRGILKDIQRGVILEVIRRHDGNKSAAARSLGMYRRTLNYMLGKERSERAVTPTLGETSEQGVNRE